MNKTIRDTTPVITGTATVDAASLREAIRFAAQHTERRPTIPVLRMLLFRFAPGALTLTGTDLDCECQTRIDAIGADTFALCLTPTTLSAVLSGASGAVTIILRSDGLLRVTTTDLTADFRSIVPAEDFPLFEEERLAGEDKTVRHVDIPEGALARILADTLPCVSTEETRYYLNGVFLHAVNGKLAGVATDGHRLALRQTDVAFEGFDGILPTMVARSLLRLLRADGNRTIRIAGTGLHRRITAEGEDWQITHKMIDGTFPNYPKVVPDIDRSISVPVSLAQIRRAARIIHTWRQPIFSTSGIHFRPSAGVMTIKAFDQNIEVDMPLIGAHGEDFGINAYYLSGMLHRIGTGCLVAKDKGGPFRLLCEDPDLTLVIMPMRVGR